jgi:hypothetical protein
MACSVTTAAGAAASAAGPGSGTANWIMAGQNIDNTGDQAQESTISPANVAGLKVKWSLTTKGDVFDTPAVSNGVLYFTDHGSSTAPSTLWAVNARTGAITWSHSIASYTGIAGDTSRSTPAVSNGLLILGDVPPLGGGAGAWLFAVNATTGALVWKTQLDSHPAAVDTSSPAVYDGVTVVGVSSLEEDLAADPSYPCCTFRGSVMALNQHRQDPVEVLHVPVERRQAGRLLGERRLGQHARHRPAGCHGLRRHRQQLHRPGGRVHNSGPDRLLPGDRERLHRLDRRSQPDHRHGPLVPPDADLGRHDHRLH